MPFSLAARVTRVPLVALLAVVTFFELLLNRIFGSLLRFEPLPPESQVLRVLDVFARFIYAFVAVLAIMILFSALARIVVRGRRYRAGARISFGGIGFICASLVTLGVMFRLPPTFRFHLHLSFTFLAALCVLAFVGSRADGWGKLGAVLMLAPVGLQLLLNMHGHVNPAPESLGPHTLDLAAEIAVLVAGAACVLLSLAAPPSRSALVGATIMAMVSWLIFRFDWETAYRVAQYGFGLDLQLSPRVQVIYGVTLAAFTYALVRLRTESGPLRLRTWGLILLAVAGFVVDMPYQVGVGAIGFLCLAEAAVREAGSSITRAQFDELMRGAASAVGTTTVTVSGGEGDETARLTSPATAVAPVSLVVSRRAGEIHEIEIVVGEKVPRDPPFTITHKSAPRGLGPRAEGARVTTDDSAFDSTMIVHDRRGVGANVLDEEMRPRLAKLITGWLGVWPQRGVQMRTRTLPDAPDALPSLIQLLVEVAAKTS